jgi:alpha-L-rhamnosidase
MYRKWMRDLTDCQAETGAVPMYAPDPLATAGHRRDGGPAWADAVVFCPWAVYRAYADTGILEASYPAMKRFVEWCAETSVDGIRCHPDADVYKGFGDWLAPGCPSPDKTPTPRDLIGTAFLKGSSDILCQTAELLGHRADAEGFRALSARTARAFQARFVTPDGHVCGETQTAYLLALAYDLLPAEQRAAAVERLVHWIDHAGGHLATGFVGTPLLCPVLSRFGRTDVAYNLLLRESYPSWLFTVNLGATTMWERWDSWTPDNGFSSPSMTSFNHYAYGAVGEWLYQTVVGICPDPELPGFKRIQFRPQPGGGLTSVEGRLRSVYGTVECAWRLEGGRFGLEVAVPPNCTGEVFLPYSGECCEVGPGRHRFEDGGAYS